MTDQQGGFRQRAARRYDCPACGGGLLYDIKSGQMRCEHCDTFTNMADLPADDAQKALEVTEFTCPQCGAAIYSGEGDVTSCCSFCGSDVVLTARLVSTQRPKLIVPFTVTREMCEQAYRKKLSGFRLLPRSFRSQETVSRFRPVYVPFYDYHVTGQTSLTLTGTKSYSRGDKTYTDTYTVSVDAEVDQKDILYDASRAFEDETAALLKATAENAVPFHPAYLSGFYAQAPDVEPDTYAYEAEAAAAAHLMTRIREEKKLDTIVPAEYDKEGPPLPGAHVTGQLVMMPVWMLAHRQGGRVICTAINGETGETVCDLPVSPKKTAGVSVLLAALFAVALFLTLTLKPNILLALCGLITLIAQMRFGKMKKRLKNRSKRAYEPSFRGGAERYDGPAQMLFRAGGAHTARVSKALRIVLYITFPFILVLISGAFVIVTSGNGADKLILAVERVLPYIMPAILVLMVLNAFLQEGGGTLPRTLGCVFMLIGTAFLWLTHEDLLYYLAAFGLLAIAVWELFLVIRAHNEYASRPAPYLTDRGEGGRS